MDENSEPLPLAVTVPAARRISGLGRTTIYRLIADGELKALKIGRRRLIDYNSLRSLIADAT